MFMLKRYKPSGRLVLWHPARFGKCYERKEMPSTHLQQKIQRNPCGFLEHGSLKVDKIFVLFWWWNPEAKFVWGDR